MARSVDHTALLLATLLRRSSQSRARVSIRTVRRASRRKALRAKFVSALMDLLAQQYGIAMFELDAGGFGLIRMTSLEAAKPATMRRLLDEDERKRLRRNDPKLFAALQAEWEQFEPADDELDGAEDNDEE